MIVKYKCIICTIIYVICVYTHKHIEGEEDKWRNGNSLKITFDGTSLAVQQLRLQAFNAGGAGLITGWGAKISCPVTQLKIKKNNNNNIC